MPAIAGLLSSAVHSLQAAEAAECTAPRLEAELLLACALKRDRLFVRMFPEHVPDDGALELFWALLARRCQGEPMAYLLGEKEFYGRPFRVRRGVLIPRPETELIIDTVLEDKDLAGREEVRFIDLGAGSGCIGLTLQLERPHWQGLLLERAGVPLAVCAENRKGLGAGRALILQADLARAPLKDASLDLVVANPPYIDEDDPEVQAGVRAHEPHEALFAAQHGLADLASCISTAARVLVPGGLIVLEHGAQQAEMVRTLLAQQNFLKILTKKDLAGLDRVTLSVYKGRRT